MRQGVKTELKEGKLCGMEDRGRGTLWKGMKKQTRSKQMRSESPEKLPALTGGSEALERGQKLLPSNPPKIDRRIPGMEYGAHTHNLSCITV